MREFSGLPGQHQSQDRENARRLPSGGARSGASRAGDQGHPDRRLAGEGLWPGERARDGDIRCVQAEWLDPARQESTELGGNMTTNTQATARPKWMLWVGRGMTGLVVLFLLFDGVTKLAMERHVVEATK